MKDPYDLLVELSCKLDYFWQTHELWIIDGKLVTKPKGWKPEDKI